MTDIEVGDGVIAIKDFHDLKNSMIRAYHLHEVHQELRQRGIVE